MVVKQSWTRVLVAGHPVLDFVNTLDNRFSDKGPTEKLLAYEDLLDFLLASALLSLSEARVLRAFKQAPSEQRVLRRVKVLRERLAALLYSTEAHPTPTLRALQSEFESAHKHLALNWSRSPSAHAYWDWSASAPTIEWPVRVLARAAESLLLSEDMASVRQCAQTSCRWLFLDLSKSHTRRWCDMKLCGNRAKASRFQARRAD
jgi:predicted RNA-binding Zn ribbon-like protein